MAVQQLIQLSFKLAHMSKEAKALPAGKRKVPARLLAEYELVRSWVGRLRATLYTCHVFLKNANYMLADECAGEQTLSSEGTGRDENEEAR